MEGIKKIIEKFYGISNKSVRISLLILIIALALAIALAVNAFVAFMIIFIANKMGSSLEPTFHNAMLGGLLIMIIKGILPKNKE